MKYSAALGSRERLVTYLVGFGVGIGLPILMAVIFFLAFNEPLLLLLPLPFVLVVLLAWLMRPVAFSFSPDHRKLYIHRRIGLREFPLSGLTAVHYPANPVPRGTIGLLASQGYYGLFGVFWNRTWGIFHAYLTNNSRGIELVWKDGRRVLLSPVDPAGFVNNLPRR